MPSSCCNCSFRWTPILAALLTVGLALGMSSFDGKEAGEGKPIVGKAAPDFSMTDLNGKTYSLKELKGKIVVLEWYNPECPYVKKQHTTGPLKTVGNKLNQEKGIVWIAINSGAAGKQGTGEKKNRDYAKKYGITYPIVLDESGKIGKTYGAIRTPHMFVIDGKGVLRYAGAIDNAPFGKTPKGTELINYVTRAIDEIKAETIVAIRETKPYGCSVKYERKKPSGGRGG